jgi:hypothetical protein
MPRTSVRSNGSEPRIPPQASRVADPEARAARMDESEYENLSIWQAMERMTPDDWSDKLLYIYRLKPMSVNKLTGDHNYIDKRIESIDQDTLKAMYGGGTFQLILNKTNPTRTLIKATVKIAGDPIIRADETLVTPPDAKAAAAPGATVVQGTSVDDTIKLIGAMKEVIGKERPQDDPTGKALTQALDLVATGAKKGMEISALEASNKSMSIEKIFELALQAREPKEDPMLKSLILPVLRRALEPPAAPKEKTLKEWLEELEALEEVLGTRGRRSNPPDSLWSVLATAASKLAEAAPDLIRAVRGGMTPQFRGPQPVVAQYGPQPPTLPPAFGGMPPGAPGHPANQPPPIDPLLITKTKIVRLFVDDDNGAIAGGILRLEAPQIFQSLKGKTLDEVKNFLGTDPILKELLGQEGVDEFVGQVLDYVNDEEPAAETVQ